MKRRGFFKAALALVGATAAKAVSAPVKTPLEQCHEAGVLASWEEVPEADYHGSIMITYKFGDDREVTRNSYVWHKDGTVEESSIVLNPKKDGSHLHVS